MSEKVVLGGMLAGKYRAERVLGSGGMGVVVAARHVALDMLVALKFMTDDARENPDLVQRFLREGRAAAQLRGEHVARVTDVGTLESGAPYQVMEYLEGSDLSELLVSEGPLPIAQAAAYLVQACEALEEAHGVGIVHRDIKPSNLFLTKRPNGSACVKVLDFGVSKSSRLGSSRNLHGSQARVVLGTPFYMAPEQMRAMPDVDARADIWALGVTLYELVTGRVPFEGASFFDLALKVAESEPTAPHRIRQDLPPALERVVLRCLEKNRDARFPTAHALASALGPLASSSDRAASGSRSQEPEPTKPALVSSIAEASPSSIGLPSVVAPQGSPAPCERETPRASRAGIRLGWGRSEKPPVSSPAVWAMTAGVLVASASLTAGAVAGSRRWAPREGAWGRSAVPLVSHAVETSNAAVDPTASPVERLSAPSTSNDPASPIPTISVSQLPAVRPLAFFAPPRRLAASTPSNCDRPTYFDQRGHMKFKEQCLDARLVAAPTPPGRFPAGAAASSPAGAPSRVRDLARRDQVVSPAADSAR